MQMQMQMQMQMRAMLLTKRFDFLLSHIASENMCRGGTSITKRAGFRTSESAQLG